MKRDVVTMFLMETVFHEAGHKAKRKFRKAWRKTAKYLIKKKVTGRYIKQTLGIGSDRPTRSQKNSRKTIVLGHILDKVVVPMRSKLCK